MTIFSYLIIFLILYSLYGWFKYRDRDILTILGIGFLALLLELWRIFEYNIFKLPKEITDLTFYLRLILVLFIVYKIIKFLFKIKNKKQ